MYGKLLLASSPSARSIVVSMSPSIRWNGQILDQQSRSGDQADQRDDQCGGGVSLLDDP